MKYLPLLFISALCTIGCNQNQEAGKETTQGEWITGDESEQLETIEDHFQGFGKAMWEVSYRYKELYVAGQNENWGYAEHHVHEMEEAIELGLERRPKHKEAATQFLTVSIPEINKAIEEKNKALFEEKYEAMRQSCNACHVMRDHEFINVKTPTDYYSVVGKAD